VRFTGQVFSQKNRQRGAQLGKSKDLLNGPGKIARFFQIDKKLNGRKAEPSNGLVVPRQGSANNR